MIILRNNISLSTLDTLIWLEIDINSTTINDASNNRSDLSSCKRFQNCFKWKQLQELFKLCLCWYNLFLRNKIALLPGKDISSKTSTTTSTICTTKSTTTCWSHEEGDDLLVTRIKVPSLSLVMQIYTRRNLYIDHHQ